MSEKITMFEKPIITKYDLQEAPDFTERTFEDRERNKENINRKTITILNQTANEMDVKIVDHQFDSDEKEGTAIKSSIMNEYQQAIKSAKKNSENSFQMAKQAINIVETTYDVVNATVALANETKDALTSFQESLEAEKGTVVTLNGEFQENYEMNQKADQAAFNSLDARVQVLENKKIITNITYDASTDTFTI